MKKRPMIPNKAKIPVQQLNCKLCARELAKRLADIKKIDHPYVSFESSAVHFSFRDIMGVAEVENLLSDYGFNPVGERIKTKRKEEFLCNAASKKLCINGD